MDHKPKCETVKLIEENRGDLYGLGLGSNFIYRTQNALIIQEKLDKLDYIITKSVLVF